MVSLIMTVKNERATLPAWLASIQLQTLQPDEIIIVDGGSSDGTGDWLQSIASKKIHVLQKSGNIATGRNFAISFATGDIIVATDAGCVYERDWLKKIVAPFDITQASQQKIVWSTTAFRPWFEEADGLQAYLLAAATTPAPSEFKRDWLPSSRSVAFTKKMWQTVGDYPEWIPYCEDVIFDLKILRAGASLQFIREPLVAWRPRATMTAFMRQLYNYTRSDGHGKLRYVREFIRYAVYGSALALCVVAAKQSVLVWLMPLALGSVLYMMKFWQRFWFFSQSKNMAWRLAGAVLLPVVIALGDCAKMIGWPIGVVERWLGWVRYQKW